jgi:aminopeptidase YwaD
LELNTEENKVFILINPFRFMKSFVKILYLVIPIILFSCSGTGKKAITTAELTEHIKYLSSDSLKGRLTGSTGDSLAASYIRIKLASYGLVPLSGDGFQRFKVTDKVLTGPNNSMKINKEEFKAEEDFLPYSFSENSSVEAEVIFTGYGFNINTDSLKWNDYDKTDVKGKWVLVLRGDPDPENAMNKYGPYSSDRNKALAAKDMGAAGILLVSGESIDKEDKFDPYARNEFSVGIPSFRIKRTVADKILFLSKSKIADLEKKINKTLKPSSFTTKTVLNATSDIIHEMANTRNVVMVLPGEDQKLKNEFIIMGAHFDHLGMGGTGSSSRKADTVAVHHGADDNASGVAMMLEIAQKFALSKGNHKRSIICIAFTGEERGLDGSRYFVDHSGIDLSKVDIMLNYDMVGRLKETKDFQINGVGTADGLKELAVSLCDTNLLKLNFTDAGAGPSDHSSFYGKDIPVLFFTSMPHDDYHTPSDTWDKINYKGMVIASDLIYKMATIFACDTARLHFRESGPKSDITRNYRRKGATLGIMPDFAGVVKNGLRVDQVTKGGPGANGGLLKNDIITAINGKQVNNIYDYMSRMQQIKKGQIVSVEILRNNKKEVLIIQL